MSFDDPTPPPQQYPAGYPAPQPQIPPPAPGYGYEQQQGTVPAYGYGQQQPPQGAVPPYGYGEQPQQGAVPPYGYDQQQPRGGPMPPGYGYNQQQPQGGPVPPGYGAVPGYGPAPVPPPKRRTGQFVGLGVAFGVVVAIVAYALTSSGPSKPAAASASSSPAASSSAQAAHKVAIPATAGGLTEMTGSAANSVTSAMSQADASDPELSGAVFGAYEKTGSTDYFGNLTLLKLTQGSTVQQAFAEEGASSALSDIVGSALTDTATEPAAEPNGAMSCGKLVDSQITLRACMWIDGSEYGLAALPDSLSNSEAAQYASALWKASEGF